MILKSSLVGYKCQGSFSQLLTILGLGYESVLSKWTPILKKWVRCQIRLNADKLTYPAKIDLLVSLLQMTTYVDDWNSSHSSLKVSSPFYFSWLKIQWMITFILERLDSFKSWVLLKCWYLYIVLLYYNWVK